MVATEHITNPNRYQYLEPSTLQHVMWIGGSPCSGKSSISDLLSKQYGIQVYHVDDAFQKYIPSFTQDLYPVCYKWTHTPWQDLWMQSPENLLDETIEAYTEQLRYIFSDLAQIPGPVIAEGTSLLPDYIKPIIQNTSKAIWVVPTEHFQREVYPKRGPFVDYVLSECENPVQALQNWMDRDVTFARWVETRTEEFTFRCIQVDGELTISQNAEIIANHFQL